MNINENSASSLSQNAKIQEWLEQGNGITAMDALDRFGCFRLASRISDLRKKLSIADRWVKTSTGKRVKEYYLVTTE